MRHGRVYLDNTDALPGAEQTAETSDYEDAWVEAPDGDYAVTVTAVEWNAEPGSDAPGADKLPNYVVCFAPRDGQEIAVAKRPPDLVCRTDEAASDAILTSTPPDPETFDPDRVYPAFASANVCRPGRSFSTQGEAPLEAALAPDADRWALFDTDFVVAANLAPGEPAVIANVRQAGGAPGEPKTYGLSARVAVRVRAQEGMVRQGANLPLGRTGILRRKSLALPQDALAGVMVEPIPDTAGTDAAPDVSALRARIIADLESGGPLGERLKGEASYEALRLRATDNAAGIANWLIDHLPLDAAERLRLCVLPTGASLEAAASAYAQMRAAT